MPATKQKGKATKAAVPQIKGVEWTATDYDSPLDTAIVYESSTASAACGHAFRLDPLIDYLEKSTETAGGSKKATCPICGTYIELVCDGMVKTLSEKGDVISTTTTTSEKTTSKESNKIVTFKYRNHLYRLSVLRPTDEGRPFYYKLCLWAWQTVMEYCGESTKLTAQERIAQVLNMDLNIGMKVGICDFFHVFYGACAGIFIMAVLTIYFYQ